MDEVKKTIRERHIALNKSLDIYCDFDFYGDFIDSLGLLYCNINEVAKHQKKRGELIDLQCYNKNFSGEDHDKYHKACAKLINSIDNYFLSLKTCLNRLSVFMSKNFLPRRNIRSKSFGSFIKSIDKIEDRNELEKFVYDNGKKIDELILEYRNKQIEHRQESDDIILSSMYGGINKVHYGSRKESEDKRINKKDDKDVCGGDLNDNVVTLSTPEGRVYYLHIKPNNIPIGKTRVSRGDSMGEINDNESGHFKKYGSHGHTFMENSVNPLYAYDARYPYQMPKTISPDPITSYLVIIDFLNNVFKIEQK